MIRGRIKVCVMRVGGTNRDSDVARGIADLGVNVEILHLNDVLRRRNLSSYDALIFPGGFAYGDYVRAGAIWGKKILSYMKEDLGRFVEAGKPILGICNGFQVLVEAGLLPGFDFLSEVPEATLAPNKSSKFECRWVRLRKNEESPCIFTKKLKQVVRFPVAHGEGRFIASNDATLKRIVDSKEISLQYVNKEEKIANRHYPENPNGSVLDIAGICNASGNVFGLMPHPENAFRGYQLPDWSDKGDFESYGDGYGIFDSMISYIEESF